MKIINKFLFIISLVSLFSIQIKAEEEDRRLEFEIIETVLNNDPDLFEQFSNAYSRLSNEQIDNIHKIVASNLDKYMYPGKIKVISIIASILISGFSLYCSFGFAKLAGKYNKDNDTDSRNRTIRYSIAFLINSLPGFIYGVSYKNGYDKAIRIFNAFSKYLNKN